MENQREIILKLLETHPQITAKHISLSIGRAHSYIQQFIQRGSPRRLSSEDWDKFMRKFGAMLSASSDMPNVSDDIVPVYGYTDRGKEGLVIDNGAITDRVSRDSLCRWSAKSFIVTVADESMMPRYRPRERIVVDPSVPPKHGEDCLIISDSDNAYIREYCGIDGDNIRTKKYNPQSEELFPRMVVSHVLAIIARV